ALENAHVVRDRCSTHIEDAAEARILHLEISGIARELHRTKCVHGHPGRANGMTLRLQPTRGVYRQFPVLLSPTLKSSLGAMPFGRQTHSFVLNKFRDGEAVV